ncbi:MAG: alpha/beta hydrolase [bacterium]
MYQNYKLTTGFLFLIAFITQTLNAQLSETAAWLADLNNKYRIVPDLVYSTASNYECKLDLYLPRVLSTPNTTVMFIHGGGWVGGTKEGAILAALPYLEMGFSVVNVEYRLARVALAPAAVEDCRLALRWIFTHAKEYSFDTTKVIVTGGSAGGHLALMTGMLHGNAGFDFPKEWEGQAVEPKVAAIINWYGIIDVNDLMASTVKPNYALYWMSSLPNRDEIAKRVSPLTYVRKGLPPILTIHGDKDQLVPYHQAVRLHEGLAKAGVPNEFLTIPGGNHGGFTREETIKIYETIRGFLKKHHLF